MSKNMKHKIIKSHLINGVVVILIGIVIFFKGPIDFRAKGTPGVGPCQAIDIAGKMS